MPKSLKEEIAERLKSPPLILETRATQGYTRMVKAIFRIAEQVSSIETPSYARRVELQDDLTGLTLAARQVACSLEEWEKITGPDLSSNRRFRATMTSVVETAARIGDALVPFGVRGFTPPSAFIPVGEWTSDDFKTQERITKTWDVSDDVTGKGVLEVRFDCADHFPLRIFRVTLASASADAPGETKEVSTDEHIGETGHHHRKANVYRPTLDDHDSDARYLLIADVEGHAAEVLSGVLKHCEGSVSIRTLMDEDWDAAAAAARTRPLTDDEYAQWVQENIPRFRGKGVRVAILEGGYGSTSLLDHLRAGAGLDAQPLRRISKLALDQCRVVVVPQPRAPLGVLPVKTLQEFVRSGGGLITTHDAVGYRGHPSIIPEVCAGGVAHVRDTEWLAVEEHPVTAGIELNKKLSHSYYDHVELEAGPDGRVLARAARSGRPVVVTGACGKGRYVACGMILGVAPDNSSIIPTGAEKILLENAIKWCARAERLKP